MKETFSHPEPEARPSDVASLLRQGVAAAKSGQREKARDLLMRVVEQDEENVAAWLWLSGVVDSLDDREICLENVLTLDPDNDLANNGLALLNKKQAQRLRQEGITAFKTGDHERARDLLTRAVERDEEDVAAWLWLSGVVDDLEERAVCLENVLALEPENAAARKGLARLREQQTALPGPDDPMRESPMMRRAQSVTSPVAAILREEFARFQEVEIAAPRAVAPPPDDEFADDYLCPYCAHPTRPEDSRCSACANALWAQFRQRENPSPLYWMLLPTQFFAAFLLGAAPVIALFIVGLRETGLLQHLEAFDILALIQIGLNLSLTEIAQAAFEVAPAFVFLILFAPCLFSYVVFAGLYLRWSKIYRLLLIDQALSLLVAGGIWLWLKVTTLSVTIALIALIRFLFARQVEEDLRWKKKRLLFQVDRGLSNASDFITRADQYTRRKMWALAMLHLRRASALAAQDPDVHIALAVAYLRLRNYERAEKSLENARQIAPEHPQLSPLKALIEEMRAEPSP